MALRRAKELEAGARASQRIDAAGQLIAENAAAKMAAADDELNDAAGEGSPEEVTAEADDGAPIEGSSEALKTNDEGSASPPAVGAETTPSARASVTPPPALQHASSEDAALAETLSGLIKEQKQAALVHMRAGDMRAAKAALERAKELGDEFAQVRFQEIARPRGPWLTSFRQTQLVHLPADAENGSDAAPGRADTAAHRPQPPSATPPAQPAAPVATPAPMTAPVADPDAPARALEQALKAALKDATQRARTLMAANDRAGAVAATNTAKQHKVTVRAGSVIRGGGGSITGLTRAHCSGVARDAACACTNVARHGDGDSRAYFSGGHAPRTSTRDSVRCQGR